MDVPGTGTARAFAPPAKEAKEPDKTPDIEAMCARVSEIRETAANLQVRAREIEVRLLGPLPPEEGAAIAVSDMPCLTGLVAADTNETRASLRDVGHSLNRIFQELGSIGDPDPISAK